MKFSTTRRFSEAVADLRMSEPVCPSRRGRTFED